MRLRGSSVVVTGGARGIGRADCERLAAKGADVVAVDLQGAPALAGDLSGPGEARGMDADVGDPGAVAATALDRPGRRDILVNTAASMPMTSLETVTSHLWRRVQAITVESIVHVAEAFVPGMAAARWGRIVATGSAAALHPQSRDYASIASKAAVHGVVKALPDGRGDKGITVNAIAPTLVETDGFAQRLPNRGSSADAIMERIGSQQTIARSCQPEDVAGALMWPVSDDAGFVTGPIVPVDGGRTRSEA